MDKNELIHNFRQEMLYAEASKADKHTKEWLAWNDGYIEALQYAIILANKLID